MKFDKFTAEKSYFSLMIKLRLNSMLFPEIRVGDRVFSVINIKLSVQVIFSNILYKKGCDFELKIHI